ncbi:poly-gamma-glutamate synthase PgsB [Halanaerobium sp.]|jgi:poly-gamma-glutamate synthase PgsB/CapB|uniref:poly-gamma-glutamate synthase PgsB n=1 Tax=Halanaerobium sp. TaxID=1895664 RepID=UPI000DE62257|nr:poly-gamma-glutamate synthase PgsB [Halanaerobium sp.]PUU93850.1 MAG: Mur ligase middle domain-containing protein [Halanaerobium sp.]
MKIIALMALIIIIIGIFERKKHNKNLHNIPSIIHVNGIRGKSSTTRLISAALRSGGLKVLAKTTGSAARIIYPDQSEKEIIRHGPPSISEQKKIVQLAVEEEVDVLVIECMAVSPEIQWSSENLFLNADYMIITNVRNDHLDKMGNNLLEIAETISLSLPYNSNVISSEKKLARLIKEKSEMRNNQYSSTDNITISKEELQLFEKEVFADNIACAIKTAQCFNIDRKTALKGMFSATEDPGSLKYYLLKEKNRNIIFINAFAANDRDSTEIIWNRVSKNFDNLPVENASIYALINHRSDRGFRLKEFAEFLTKKNRFNAYLLSGALKFRQRRLLKKILNSQKNILNLNLSIFALNKFNKLSNYFNNLESNEDLIIFGCGNIHGDAEIISKFFSESGVEIKC